MLIGCPLITQDDVLEHGVLMTDQKNTYFGFEEIYPMILLEFIRPDEIKLINVLAATFFLRPCSEQAPSFSLKFAVAICFLDY